MGKNIYKVQRHHHWVKSSEYHEMENSEHSEKATFSLPLFSFPWVYIDILSLTATWFKEPLVRCSIAFFILLILCHVQVPYMNYTTSSDTLGPEWSCDDDHMQHTNLIYQTQCTFHSNFLPKHKNPNIHLQPVSDHHNLTPRLRCLSLTDWTWR